MIIYDLVCDAEHRFEGWFDNAADYTRQHEQGRLSCPVCGSESVRKVPSAAFISGRAGAEIGRDMQEAARLQQRSAELLRKLHKHVDGNYEDVGTRFAREAQRIHYGEAPQRNIRGVATAQEVQTLREHDIAALPLPPPPVDKGKLN